MAQAVKKQAPTNLFNGMRTGSDRLKPLMHKDGRAFDDFEYFELLGRKAIEMNEANKTRIPTDYGDYDKDTVNLAIKVVEAYDSGEYTKDELGQYISSCLDY